MLLVNKFRFGYDWENAFFRTLMAPFEGTVWSENFTEAGFDNIQISMTQSRVSQLVGEPLRKNCDYEGCFWIYTHQDTQTADFDQRWVIFDANGKVEEIRKSFFID